MTVATKILMGSGAVAKPLEIDQSIIFDEASHISSMVRTPSTTGNRRTWTLSVWLKRVDFALGSPNGYQMIYGGQSAHESTIRTVDNKLNISGWTGSATEFNWSSTRELRDPSAWYHLVVAFDSTQGTNTNRIKVYINGVQETPTSVTWPSQNLDTRMNLAGVTQYIGRYHNPAYSYNGYMAEFNWLDGTAAAASSFGKINDDTGQWIPKKYSGSYGTNGFYLKFASGAIGTDSSGEGNNYTATNLANSDVVTDSPTNNFATWNSLIKGSNTYSGGNLIGTNSTSAGAFMASTIGVSSGKYYCEIIIPSLNNWNVGIANSSAERSFIGVDAGSGGWLLYASTTTQYVNSSATSISQGWAVGNYVGLGIDADNKVFYLYKNGTQVISYDYSGFAGDEAFFGAGNYSAVANTIVNFGQNPTHCGGVTAGTATDGNGIGLFKYAPPSGFLALCTANLPDPAIPLPSTNFNTVLYAGDGSTNNDISGVGFQPDFVWIKNRSQADSHVLNDAVRGAGKTLYSDLASGEANNEAYFGPFQTDGFRLAPSTVGHAFNANNEAYVSWNWKAGGTAPVKTYVVKVVSDSGNKYRFDDFAASTQTVDLQ